MIECPRSYKTFTCDFTYENGISFVIMFKIPYVKYTFRLPTFRMRNFEPNQFIILISYNICENAPILDVK